MEMNLPVLVYFGTFDHHDESLSDLHIDLVQFSKTVIVRDIRIVPKGVTLPLNPAAGATVGCTEPGIFPIDFFVNNLTLNNSSAFQSLGTFKYNAATDIQFLPRLFFPTDGLLLRGRYSRLTLAIFGEVAPDEHVTRCPEPIKALEQLADLDDTPKAGSGDIHKQLRRKPNIKLAQPQPSPSSQVNRQPQTPVPMVPTPPSVPTAPGAHIVSPPSSMFTGVSLIPPAPSPLVPPPQAPIHVPSAAGPGTHVMLPPQSPHQSSLVSSGPPPPGQTPGTWPSSGSHPPPPGFNVHHGHPSHPPPQYMMTFDPTIPPPSVVPPSRPEVVTTSSPGALGPPLVPTPPRVTTGLPPPVKSKSGHSTGSSGSTVGPGPPPAPSSSSSRQHSNSSSHHRESSSSSTGSKNLTPSSRSSSGTRSQSSSGSKNPQIAKLLEQHHHQSRKANTPPRRTDSQLEEGEYTDSDDDGAEQFDYENISDEEFEYPESMDIEDFIDELGAPSAQFNAYTFDMSDAKLEYFNPPWLSRYQIESKAVGLVTERQPNAAKIVSAIETFATGPYNADWILTVESLIPEVSASGGLVYLLEKEGRKDVAKTLCDWALKCIDFYSALQQPQPVFKIRQMKAGIKLVGALCETKPEIATLLLERKVQHTLFDLYHADYMSLPIQLLILAAMDRSTFFEEGMLAFTKQIGGDGHRVSPYARLVEIMLTKQNSRIVAAVVPLLRKVHHFQAIQLLKAHTHRLAAEGQSKELLEDEKLRENICSSLEEAWTLLNFAPDLIAQPRRTLPCTVVFEKQPCLADPYPSVYQMLCSGRFLENIVILCSHEFVGANPDILTWLQKVLTTLRDSQFGITYLASRPQLANLLVKVLLQSPGGVGVDDGGSEGGLVEDVSAFQQQGLDLAFRLQALLYIDELMKYHASGVVKSDVDNCGPRTCLHNLYCLSYASAPQGQYSVVPILSKGNNLDAILPFVQLTGDKDMDGRIKKSACAGYATELLLLVLRNSQSAEMLAKFAEKLLLISSQDVTSKMSEVKHWVEVMRKIPAFNNEAVPYLAQKLKTYVSEANLHTRIPKGLITTLRILKHLIVEPVFPKGIDHPEELKYKYCILLLHSADAFKPLIQLLEKLADSHLYTWMQGLSLNSTRGRLLMSILLPGLAIVRSVLSYLIKCRGSDFKDVTAVPTLLKLYTVTCTMVPPGGSNTSEIQKLRDECIKCFLTYTQPEIVQRQSDAKGKQDETTNFQALRNSLWTEMLSEILKFSRRSPYAFMGGLNALSELLPLPLPVQTKEALNDAEAELLLSTRRLWSAHLMALTAEMQELIAQLSPSTFTPLQQSLRRLCIQLSDLAPPIALNITKALLDTVIEYAISPDTAKKSDQPKSSASASKSGESHGSDHESTKSESTAPVDKVQKGLGTVNLPGNENLARVLGFVSYLQSHAPIKHALLHLLSESENLENNYSLLLPCFITVFNHVSSKAHHLMCQESIASIITSWCDEEISVLDAPEGQALTMQQLVAALPNYAQLEHVCEALMAHIGNEKHGYASVLPSLRALVMLTEHDFGLFHIKGALEKVPGAILRLLQRLNEQFSRDSSDCLSTLSTLVQLLNSLKSLGPEPEGTTGLRTLTVDVQFLKENWEWKYGQDTNNEHHLMLLKRQLEEHGKEDETLSSLSESVSSLVAELSSGGLKEPGELKCPVLPVCDDLVELFAKRPIWALCSEVEEDRLRTNYWLPLPTLDFVEDEDLEQDKVPCDLESLRVRYFPHFQLEEELKQKLCRKIRDASKRKQKLAIINTARGEKKSFAAPMRGRGFNTPRGARGGPRMQDPFRNRAPNTSRPPSMHVDDFVVLEAEADKEKGGTTKGPGGVRDRGRGRRESRQGGPVRDRSRPGSFSSYTGGNRSQSGSYYNRSRKVFRSAYEDRLLGDHGRRRSK